MAFRDRSALRPPNSARFTSHVSTEDLIDAVAIGDENHGKLREAAAWKSEAPVTLYRVYDGSHPRRKMGNWWTFKNLYNAITEAEFRKRYVICEEWSKLDRVATATLKPDTVVLIGNGQSAHCRGTYLPASPVRQVYIIDPPSAFEPGATDRPMKFRPAGRTS